MVLDYLSQNEQESFLLEVRVLCYQHGAFNTFGLNDGVVTLKGCLSDLSGIGTQPKNKAQETTCSREA